MRPESEIFRGFSGDRLLHVRPISIAKVERFIRSRQRAITAAGYYNYDSKIASNRWSAFVAEREVSSCEKRQYEEIVP